MCVKVYLWKMSEISEKFVNVDGVWTNNYVNGMDHLIELTNDWFSSRN